MDFKKFEKPDSILRPAPFWAINDRITPEETARQMADMIEVGLSGGFFHSRAGLITDYLGKEWFEAMDAALKVAKEQDGYVWLYDEDLWPSGNAGGQVAGMKDDYRAATLEPEFVPIGETPDDNADEESRAAHTRNTLPHTSVSVSADDAKDGFRAAYLIERSGARIQKVERISLEEAFARTDAERVIFRRVYAPKTGWWGGESYANLLHPEAMKQFVKLTHEVYKEKLGKEFGGRVPGIFTDEPQLTWSPSAIPWYEGFPSLYQEWTGRNFWADLPFLFFDGNEDRKIRLLFHRAMLRQFCEAYSKPLYEWCEANKLEHTGHYMWEDTFETQIRSHLGGVMAHYRYQQAPGIDHLGRHVDPMLMSLKQVGSAARQLGRKRVLTELFGCSRHTNTFQGLKWIGDYNLVLGATFLCPHLTWYSARGRRKRDYPPVWNYQQTYWKELRPLNDYFARVSAAMMAGEAKVEVLLLHSIESATAQHRFGTRSVKGVAPTGEDQSAAHFYDGEMRRTLDSILNAGFECDLGDEGYLADMGSVQGNRLQVGKMSYSVVVVPPSRTWRPSTFKILSDFQAAGGKLIFLGELPSELDCDSAAERWKALADTPGTQVTACASRNIQEALDRVVESSFRLRDPEGYAVPKTYLQHRVDGGQEIFFIANSDPIKTQEYVFSRAGDAKTLYIWNPLDGTRSVAPVKQAGDEIRYSFTLPPCGTLLLVADSAKAAVSEAPATVDLSTGEISPLPNQWKFARSEWNVLAMDRISASPDGGKTWWDEDREYRVRQRLAEHFGTTEALQWQPWVAIRKGIFNGKGGPVSLRYHFRSALNRPVKAYLVMEDLQKGELFVNGRKISTEGMGWHFDRGFGLVEISDLVTKGENQVEFRFAYDFLSEVEPAYIVGDFGVRVVDLLEPELIEEPAQLQSGSWVPQGYPFYSGNMTYKTAIEGDGRRAFLRLSRASGILYKVRLNGEEVGKILWRPHQIELTSKLKRGSNELEIEVVTSRQNTFGPLHEKQGDDPIGVGPENFQNDWGNRDEFTLFDYGLLGGAEIIRID